MDPRTTREADPLYERPPGGPDQEHERPTGPRIVEGDVDLARWSLEADVETDGRRRFEDQEPRQVREGDRHNLPTRGTSQKPG
jgi:hypothetical protein